MTQTVEINEFIEKYLSDPAIDYTKEQIIDSFQEYLVDKGYGIDHFNATVEYVTDGGKGVDFRDFLQTEGDSKFAAKLASMDVAKTYSYLATITSFAVPTVSLFDDLADFENYLNDDGTLSKDAKDILEQSLNNYLKITGEAMNFIPGGFLYSTILSELPDGISYAIKAGTNYNDNVEASTFLSSNLLTSSKWENWKNGDWENGPSLEELEDVYNKVYEGTDILDEYLEWKIQYEFEKELKDAGIDVEEYYDMMEDLCKHSSSTPKIEDELNDKSKELDLAGYYSLSKTLLKTFVNVALKKIQQSFEAAENEKNCTPIYSSSIFHSHILDPLILDLDNDGYNVETKENGTNFDLDKNGFAEKINWTTKDGFLCLDLNNNGTIDDGGELFGDKTLLADGTEAANGFEALTQYDSNSDGVIDANDEIFDSLRVWVDADGSGTSGEDELKTLAELGVTSISLGCEAVNAETGTEATIGNAATFTYADGTTGNIGELWVSADLFDTVDTEKIDIPDDIAALPNLGGMGNAYSLHKAMVLDETGELKALVESFAAEQDMDKRMALAEQILIFTCGANAVEDGSRGANFDAAKLKVLETVLGEGFVGIDGTDVPNAKAAAKLSEAYDMLVDMYYNELAAQTYIKDYVQMLRYTENEDGTKVLNVDLVNYVLEYQLANGDENAKGILVDVARYVQYLDNGGIKGMSAFVANYAAISTEYAEEIFKVMPNGYIADGVNALNGASSADLLVGSINGETISAGSGNDILIGGEGNDTLYGGADNDTYIFNLGDGNDVINEQNYASAADKVVFGEGVSAEDISISRSGNNMIIKYSENDSVTIVNQYSSTYYQVETFEFADGTTKKVADYLNTSLTITGEGTIEDFTTGFGTRNTTLIGSDEADTIYGYTGSDILIGAKGNDTLCGGADNDTYIFNLGDGNDVINEQGYASAADKVVFGEGVSIDDIVFSKSGNNLVIGYADTDDSVTIINQNSSSYYQIENFATSDGYTIDYSKVNQLIQAMASFEADTGMSWTEAVEQGNETATGIVSEMWVKSVS